MSVCLSVCMYVCLSVHLFARSPVCSCFSVCLTVMSLNLFARISHSIVLTQENIGRDPPKTTSQGATDLKSLIHSFTHSLTQAHNQAVTNLLTPPLANLPTHSFTGPLTHAPFHSLKQPLEGALSNSRKHSISFSHTHSSQTSVKMEYSALKQNNSEVILDMKMSSENLLDVSSARLHSTPKVLVRF